MTPPSDKDRPDDEGQSGAGSVVEERLGSVFNGERIDRVVSTMTGVSRKEASDLIAGGQVTINGDAPLKVSHRVAQDDVVSVALPAADQLAGDPTVDVPLVYADEHLLVVEKPAGLVVHPGAGTPAGTLIQGVLARYPEIRTVGDDLTRPGVVHRLDRGTTGLLLVALTQTAFESLTDQLRDRSVERLYRTLVHGHVEGSSGVVDAPIGRSIRQPTRQTVSSDGKPSVTRYAVVRRFGVDESKLTELECNLETGRTHQIRVHMEAIGHPVVGDDRYFGRKGSNAESYLTKTHGLVRPFLHAATLGFVHPTTGETMRFESALPTDLQNLLDQLALQQG